MQVVRTSKLDSAVLLNSRLGQSTTNAAPLPEALVSEQVPHRAPRLAGPYGIRDMLTRSWVQTRQCIGLEVKKPAASFGKTVTRIISAHLVLIHELLRDPRCLWYDPPSHERMQSQCAQLSASSCPHVSALPLTEHSIANGGARRHPQDWALGPWFPALHSHCRAGARTGTGVGEGVFTKRMEEGVRSSIGKVGPMPESIVLTKLIYHSCRDIG